MLGKRYFNMAQFFTSGFETNELPGEWDTKTGTKLSIVTSPVYSGTYSLRVNKDVTSYQILTKQFSASDVPVTYYKLYFRFAASVSGAGTPCIISCYETASQYEIAGIEIGSDNKLHLIDLLEGAFVGDPSYALSLDTWYRIELKVDMTTPASTFLEGKINGTVFASGTVDMTRWDNTFTGAGYISVGAYNSSSTIDAYIDDVFVSDYLQYSSPLPAFRRS
jgi:hypothetical protein